MKTKGSFLTVLLLSVAYVCQAQIKADTSDLLFFGSKINPYAEEYDSTAKFTYSGYIDAYYGFYTDSAGYNEYQKFPTISPKSNQLGLNMLQFSCKYISERFRGTATVFYGDIPQSSWSPVFNLIQEANMGFRVVKKLWLEAGFFRTHIGLESIQPRENMTLSLASTTYFEPYFLSGAKLTWEQSKKWTFQINAFNSFNQFIETNKNKAVGFSTSFTPNARLSASFSTILCDESPDSVVLPKMRSYSNFILIYSRERFKLGFEVNYGWQQHSGLRDSLQPAFMFSSLLALKYRFTSHWAGYLRGEIYSDPNEILTGPLVNSDHQLVGLDLVGATAGLEFKPIPNSYVRLEGRILRTKRYENIFMLNHGPDNHRLEILAGIGLWF